MGATLALLEATFVITGRSTTQHIYAGPGVSGWPGVNQGNVHNGKISLNKNSASRDVEKITETNC